MTLRPHFAILVGANQSRSEHVPNSISLPISDHQLDQPVTGWAAHYARGSHPPMVELIASVQSAQPKPGWPSRGSTATTLAIQMDAQVAIDLYQRLGNLARSMGWQLPP
jgi:hypothetical protein